MRLYLTILVIAFATGATPLGRSLARRPLIVLAACVVAGSLFYSYRFVN